MTHFIKKSFLFWLCLESQAESLPDEVETDLENSAGPDEVKKHCQIIKVSDIWKHFGIKLVSVFTG